jgi:hypothetical protein
LSRGQGEKKEGEKVRKKEERKKKQEERKRGRAEERKKQKRRGEEGFVIWDFPAGQAFLVPARPG